MLRCEVRLIIDQRAVLAAQVFDDVTMAVGEYGRAGGRCWVVGRDFTVRVPPRVSGWDRLVADRAAVGQ
jgi:hypothetical protein